MFWGRGDSSRLSDKEAETLAQLRRMVETGHIKALTAEEAETAVRALNFYEMWESTFKLLGAIRNTAILIGALMAIWVATEGALLDFIRGVGP